MNKKELLKKYIDKVDDEKVSELWSYAVEDILDHTTEYFDSYEPEDLKNETFIQALFIAPDTVLPDDLLEVKEKLAIIALPNFAPRVAVSCRFLEGLEILKEAAKEKCKEYLSDLWALSELSELGYILLYNAFEYLYVDTEQIGDYIKLQLSANGPACEIRFFDNGSIYFVYADYDGSITFDITHNYWLEKLNDNREEWVF